MHYFYLSILRRAARAGHARGAQQTPYEYGQALAERLPEAVSEVTALTQAFVEARYSQRVLGDQETNAIKKIWWRVRVILMRRIRSGEQDRVGEL